MTRTALALLAAGLCSAQTKVNPKDGLTYVFIPPGTFMMGCSPGDQHCHVMEKPLHQVTITKGFWIGQLAVTNAAYNKIVPKKRIWQQGRIDTPNVPVNQLNWYEAKAYCGAVGMTLPTEAQWEYAARGGTTTPIYGPLNDIAWNDDDPAFNGNHQALMPGGMKKPNAFGLYDMIGNIGTWVLDYLPPYTAAPVVDPIGDIAGVNHMVRGAPYGETILTLRASHRSPVMPIAVGPGVRCAGN